MAEIRYGLGIWAYYYTTRASSNMVDWPAKSHVLEIDRKNNHQKEREPE